MDGDRLRRLVEIESEDKRLRAEAELAEAVGARDKGKDWNNKIGRK